MKHFKSGINGLLGHYTLCNICHSMFFVLSVLSIIVFPNFHVKLDSVDSIYKQKSLCSFYRTSRIRINVVLLHEDNDWNVHVLRARACFCNSSDFTCGISNDCKQFMMFCFLLDQFLPYTCILYALTKKGGNLWLIIQLR